MGRWEYRLEKRRPLKFYFRLSFFGGLFCNFIVFMACSNVKYSDDTINKAKWLGAVAGFCFNMVGAILLIIADHTIISGVLAILSIVVWISGVIFGILYKYKGNNE